MVNPKYRFCRKIPHSCAAHSANQLKSQFAATCAPKIIQFDFSDDMRVRKIPRLSRDRAATPVRKLVRGNLKGGQRPPL